MTLNLVFTGILIAASFVSGLFFLRFWRQTRDRFFALFAAAFWVLSANWVGIAITAPATEARTYFYILRLGAFLLILLAIWHKNQQRSQRAL
jgi:hypothetical protein